MSALDRHLRLPNGYIIRFGLVRQRLPNADLVELRIEDAVAEPAKDIQHVAGPLSEPMVDFLDLIAGNEGPTRLILVFPTRPGYVFRSDYLSFYFRGCREVKSVLSFLKPLGQGTVMPDTAHLPSLVDACAGLLHVDPAVDIEHHLRARFTVPLTLPGSPKQSRIALVRGRPSEENGRGIYAAAKALGIALVIIDDQSHWLYPNTRANLQRREGFIAVDMTEDDGVADRFIAGIRAYPLPIHGIFTVSDNYFTVVARVAEELGYKTSPSSAYTIAANKYLSRQLQGQWSVEISCNSDPSVLSIAEDVSFPLIVKPVKGWSSLGVRRVENRESLVEAIQNAHSCHNGNVVVEPYFAGPEIDVNLVMYDGQVLFREICDELPCEGDDPLGAGNRNTFVPNAMMYPSMMESSDQEAIFDTVESLVRRAGFHSGIMHVEARVCDSNYEYVETDGVVDLVQTSTGKQLTCQLLEINARTPGYSTARMIRETYGMDYYAAQMLIALGDPERLKLAVEPFAYRHTNQPGPQYWSQVLRISCPGDGCLRSREFLKVLVEQNRHLGKYVSWHHCPFKQGDRIREYIYGGVEDFAAIGIVSNESRIDMMRAGQEIRAKLVIELDDDSSKFEEDVRRDSAREIEKD